MFIKNQLLPSAKMIYSHFNLCFFDGELDTRNFLEWFKNQINEEKEYVYDEFIKNSFEVDEIRNFLKKHQIKNRENELKILVIRSYGISNHSQNSLLKFTEEPPLGTIIFLILPNGIKILPTLKSRANIIEISPDFIIKEKKIKGFEIKIFLSSDHKKRLDLYSKINDEESSTRKQIIRNLLNDLLIYSRKQKNTLPNHFLTRLPFLISRLGDSSVNTKLIFEEIAISLPVNQE